MLLFNHHTHIEVRWLFQLLSQRYCRLDTLYPDWYRSSLVPQPACCWTFSSQMGTLFTLCWNWHCLFVNLVWSGLEQWSFTTQSWWYWWWWWCRLMSTIWSRCMPTPPMQNMLLLAKRLAKYWRMSWKMNIFFIIISGKLAYQSNITVYVYIHGSIDYHAWSAMDINHLILSKLS